VDGKVEWDKDWDVVACSCPFGDGPTAFDVVMHPFQSEGEVYDCFLEAPFPCGLAVWVEEMEVAALCFVP
jgi:hypothetical protein